jgi:hypothetical protein
MSRYTPEEIQARIAEARDLLADMDAADALAARSSMADAESESDRKYRYGIRLAKSDGLERRRREAEATRKQEQKMLTDAEEARRWEQWVERRIADALAQHTRATEQDDEERARALADLIGDVLAGERKRVREQIQTAVAELRAELNLQRGQILDLPNPLRRRTHAA